MEPNLEDIHDLCIRSNRRNFFVNVKGYYLNSRRQINLEDHLSSSLYCFVACYQLLNPAPSTNILAYRRKQRTTLIRVTYQLHFWAVAHSDGVERHVATMKSAYSAALRDSPPISRCI